MDKKLFWLSLSIYFCCGCKPQPYPASVFLMKSHSKAYLGVNGFEIFKPRIKGMKYQSNGNKLWKVINDTSILYGFSDEKLTRIIITISLRHTDTAAIYKVLNSLGFVTKIVPGQSDVFVENKNEGIQYHVFIEPLDMVFVNTLNITDEPQLIRDSSKTENFEK
jgi:hypothetical protein